MSQSLWELKQQMCDVGSRIWKKGFCAGNEGNHSARIGEDRFLCTPTGLSKGFLDPEDMIVVDGEGKQVESNSRGRKPTSEIKVHLAIYKKRPDVGAVVHSHPPHATAFAIANIALPEGIHPEAEVFLGRVIMAPFGMPSTHDLPNSFLPKITEQTNSVLLGNHGTVNFSNTLIDAYYKLEILDAYCRILLLVHQLGKVNVLNAEQMTGLLEVKEKFGLPDDRLSCAPQGCVGDVNDQFLATFPDRPASATCNCQGHVHSQSAAEAVAAASGAPGGAEFEQMVQSITDQVMAAAGR